ncbi:MAG TPA: galactokinase family protein [Vicinamibacterales bacterium]|nr:galactokinase family protein [Vicinamibacterales bacterium]
MPVTAASAAEALMARGMDPAEFKDKQMLYHRVVELHATLRGGPPEFAWWVPGRLEVFGKHTDYAGGRTLVCAAPRGFAVVASRRDDGVVQVADAWRGDHMSLRLSDSAVPQAGWRHYVDVTIRRLARNFPGAELSADIVIASDLPPAAGMSSSSALIIAVAVALVRAGALQKHRAWIQNIRSGLDAAGYYACIENGRRFAALEGDGGVGTQGGSEDHTAIIEARPGSVSAFAFVPPRAVGGAPVPDTWRFVIAPSGVAARKTGEARAPYNRLASGIARLLEVWNRESPMPAVSLAAALRSGPAAIDRMRQLAATAATDDLPAAWLRDRLEHFIREDARIEKALAAFASADEAAIGALAADSQRDAEILLANQVPATSSLAAQARQLGAIAGCSFGAGFGGAVWALARTPDAEAFARRWHPNAFVMSPGPGVTEVSSR